MENKPPYQSGSLGAAHGLGTTSRKLVDVIYFESSGLWSFDCKGVRYECNYEDYRARLDDKRRRLVVMPGNLLQMISELVKWR